MIVLNKKDIQQLLPMSKCIQIMKELFSLNPQENFTNPLRSKIFIPEHKGILGMMPAYIKSYSVMGVKVISIFPENYKFGFSSHQGTILLFESKYGKQIATLDADEITGIRTAAVSALATKLLSRENSKTLCILGSGVQASTHIEAIINVRNIEKITVWSPNVGRLNSFVEKESAKCSIPIISCNSAKEAAKDTDIICTVTASSTPILKNKWVSPGTHINAVGVSTPKAREIGGNLVKRSKLYVDNYEANLNESGNLIIPIEEGLISKNHIQGDIYEFLSGKTNGRENENDVTLFSSVGIAVEDIAVAHYLYKTKKGAQ